MGKEKEFNIGWAFLRIWMSFEVVLVHYWSRATGEPGMFLRIFDKVDMLAVPVFMLMAFILTERTIRVGERKQIGKRLYRLFLPYAIWAVIYWLVYWLAEILSGEEIITVIGDLGWQLLLGSSRNLNGQMWYQFDLIVLTLLFVVLFKLLKEKAMLVSYVLFLLSLVLQYSGINYSFFIKFECEVFNPLGRICEMMPYACLGIWISRADLLQKMNRKYLLVCVTLIGLLLHYQMFTTPMGYSYPGVNGIVMATLFVVTFYLLPFNRLPIILKSGIVFVSKYSLGIFCIHMLVGKLLNLYVLPRLGWRLNTFRECILIWLISFVCSYMIAKLPFKWCKSLVV